MRLAEVRPGHWALWIRGTAVTLTTPELEELFDKIGMAIEGLTDDELDSILLGYTDDEAEEMGRWRD